MLKPANDPILMQQASTALHALVIELSDEPEILIENPLALVSKIHTLGETHPCLKADVSNIMQDLKRREITVEPPTSSDDIKVGIFIIRKFLNDLAPAITTSEFKAVTAFIESNDSYNTASAAIDVIIRNGKDYLHKPIQFAEQIRDFRTVGNLLSRNEQDMIISLVCGTPFSPTESEPTLLSDAQMSSLKELAISIHSNTSIIERAEVERLLYADLGDWEVLPGSAPSSPIENSFELLDFAKPKIKQAHEAYKTSLLEALSPDEQEALSFKKKIPIPVLGTKAFLAALIPEGEDLKPTNPSDIPHQFSKDLLNESGTGSKKKTRGANKTFSFHSTLGNDPAVIASPKTTVEGEKIVRQATQFAKKIMPSDASETDILEMRNYILAFSSQHLPNTFVMPLTIEANQWMGGEEIDMAFEVARDTIHFYPVTKDGIIQTGKFQLVYESKLGLKVVTEEISSEQQGVLRDLCMAMPAVATVHAEFTFEMTKTSGEWIASTSSTKASYNLQKDISL